MKIFARKLIRRSAISDSEEIQNEIRVVDKLCAPATAQENIVIVLKHGTLRNSPYYFFDMELCDFNLEHYIPVLWEPTSLEKITLHSEKEAPVNFSSRMKYIWSIMCQIAKDLAFIHDQNEVHRDLKPRNSTKPCLRPLI